MGLLWIEQVQTLKEAQDQLLFQVLAILLGEAGAADEQPDLASNDALGETVENDVVVVKHWKSPPGRGGEKAWATTIGEVMQANAKRRRCEERHDRRRPQSPPLRGRQNVR
jgi:hypothetical protein